MKKIIFVFIVGFSILFSLPTLLAQPQLKTSIPNEIHLLQHPFKPMNILLKSAAIEGITAQPGDLVMAFAGEVCSGAAIVEDVSKVLNLVATSTDEVNKGYKSGEPIRLEYHSLADNTVYDLAPTKILLGSMSYEELGTLYADFKANVLGVEEMETPPAFNVYPNPVSQQLYVVLETDSENNAERLQLKLVGMSGNVVLTHEYPANQTVITLEVGGLATGEYTLVIQQGKIKYVQKVIKK